MSKTRPGAFRGVQFWVYDLCASLLLAELLTVLEGEALAGRATELAAIEHELRVHATVGDLFLPFDEWADRDETTFVALVAIACDRLAARGAVTAAEAEAWVLLDGMTVTWRGDQVLATDPVVTFGRALIDMAAASYPSAPPGHRWYFGWPDGVRTIRVGGAT